MTSIISSQPRRWMPAAWLTSRVIAAISSATELATGDAVFVSLEHRVNMAQYEAGLMEEIGMALPEFQWV